MQLIDINQVTMFENAYDCRFHSKTLLRYHIIFSTKYRYRCLNPIRDTLFSAFRDAESKSDIEILTMEIDWVHIPLLVSFPPTYSISQVVGRLKQMTTNYIYSYQYYYMRHYYWRNKIFLL